jgi:hypothetical protein
MAAPGRRFAFSRPSTGPGPNRVRRPGEKSPGFLFPCPRAAGGAPLFCHARDGAEIIEEDPFAVNFLEDVCIQGPFAVRVEDLDRVNGGAFGRGAPLETVFLPALEGLIGHHSGEFANDFFGRSLTGLWARNEWPGAGFFTFPVFEC